MRPIFLLLPIMAVLMIGGLVISEQSDDSDALARTWTSGACTCTLDDSTGVFTVTGNGAMQDYASQSDQPWYSYRAGMTKLVIKDGVTGIGNNCFRGTAIREIQWPSSSLTSIWNEAFLGTGLIWVSMPNSVTTWGNAVFQNCGSLSQVELPTNLTSIPQSMFMNCTSLTAINIPTSVESIGVSAFKNTGLTSVFIPDEVETIGNYAFQGCTTLAFARLGMGYDGAGGGIFSNCTALKEVAFAEGILTIGESMFNGCTALKTISLPSALREIKQDAFRNTPALTWQAIPSSIRTIGSNAFTTSDLKGLLFFGATWNGTSIQNNSFSSTESTVSVWSTNNVANTKLDGKGGSVNFLYNTLPATQSWTSGQCTLTLTTTTGLLTITGTGAMADYTSSSSVPWQGNFAQLIKVIKVGSGVTKIGNMAFYDDRNLLSGLNRIYWDSGGASNLTIGESAFRDCYTLESVSFPSSCIGVGDNAFNGCRGLRSLELPAQLTSIGEKAFNSLHSMTDLNLNLYTGSWNFDIWNYANSLKNITVASANTAYSSNNGVLFSKDGQTLKVIPFGRVTCTIPSGTITIDPNVARGGLLGKVVIPSSVTGVGGQAFVGCTRLTSLELPSACVSVSSIAFADCINIRDIYLHGSSRYTHTPGSNAFNLNRNSSATAITCNVWYDGQSSQDAVRTYLGTYTNLTWNIQEQVIVVTIVSGNTDYGTVSISEVRLPYNGGTATIDGNRINIGGTWVTATPTPATAQYTYSFDNWSGVPSGGTITSDCTITANFTRTVNEYTVTFEVNDDEFGSVSPATVTVPYGTQIRTSSSNPSTLTIGDTTVTATRSPWTPGAKYFFDSWSGIPSPATVTGDLTITANFHMEVVSYTLTFNVDPLGYGNVSPSTVTAEYGTPITTENNRLHIGDVTVIPIPLNPTQEWAYSFDRWNNLPETVTGDSTITAVFVRNPVEYTVTYDGNSGTPETQTETVGYGSRADLSGHTAEKEGWAFLGWNTDQGQTVPLSEYTVTGDVTLYAVFAEIVNYDIPIEEYIDGLTHTEYSSGGILGTIFMIIPLLLGLAIVMFLARSMGVGFGRRRY